MSKKLNVSPALALALLWATTCGAAAQVTIPAKKSSVRLVTREVSLGRAHPGELKDTRTLSPDRRHIAFVAKMQGGEQVFVDGAAGNAYPSIANDPLSEAGTGSPITFSKDGSRVAYVVQLAPPDARSRGRRLVVLDGKEGAQFDYIWSGALRFSEDGKRFAYTAERRGKRYVVVDGAESKPFDYVAAPTFSKDGARVAFEARRDKQNFFVVDGQEYAAEDPAGRTQFHGAADPWPREIERDGKRFVVWQGGESGPYTEVRDPSLRSAGKRTTFTAKRDGKEFAVVDGVESKPYEQVTGIYVSPDGGRVLFVARQGEESLVVLDGKEGEKYYSVEIEYPSPFSPDGKRYAYKATRLIGEDSRESFVVADGKEGKAYHYLDHVTFTPDGEHLLYLAYSQSERKTFLVRDGGEVASYPNTPGYGGFRFSPDGKRMFFRLEKLGEGKETLVLDGRAFAYNEIRDAEFSPSGNRFILKARRGRGWLMVVDGTESEMYDPDGDEPGKIGWSRDGRLAFSKDGGRLAYVGRKGGRDFVVTDGIATGARYEHVGNLAFTPGGRHVIHTARRGGKSLVVVDGVEGREYDGFVPERKYEKEGKPNVESDKALSILATRGAQFLRVEIEIVEE